ncbi:TetR/AcrR family transcriptional regulator [Massilia putida]|uniref:TetR/AcrR family transcriptional regulator n=1 Tax=Massilia putida TaxID=1141883 RepID=UPI000950DD1F|nr:TetR/AcrR family transcriptional regulator [Massilia putida]
MKEPSDQPNGKKAPAEPERNLRAQGQRTRNAIIEVAKGLLLEGGSLEFTLREVALRAGISISNLQYYFPTRLAVLRAVVEPVVEAYLGELRQALTAEASSRAMIDALVDRALEDAKNAERTALWWHFVSLAAIDPECSQLLDEWYEEVTPGIAKFIRAVDPACKPADSLHRATLLIAMADGLSFQLGAGRRKRSYTRGLDAKFRAAVDCILLGGMPRAADG